METEGDPRSEMEMITRTNFFEDVTEIRIKEVERTMGTVEDNSPFSDWEIMLKHMDKSDMSNKELKALGNQFTMSLMKCYVK
jgi:hypothetical protein